MKTTIQNLAVLILLVSTMNVYSQEYDNRGVRKDYTRPIAGLTIQEIRNAVYGVPAYQEGKTVLSERFYGNEKNSDNPYVVYRLAYL